MILLYRGPRSPWGSRSTGRTRTSIPIYQMLLVLFLFYRSEDVVDVINFKLFALPVNNRRAFWRWFLNRFIYKSCDSFRELRRIYCQSIPVVRRAFGRSVYCSTLGTGVALFSVVQRWTVNCNEFFTASRANWVRLSMTQAPRVQRGPCSSSPGEEM